MTDTETPSAETAEVAPDWKAGLPEALRADPTVARLGSLEEAVKMLVHAERMVGRDKVALPGENAGDEDWALLWDRLGRPEDPSGYAFDGGEGADLDEALVDRFRETAHGLGLLPAQAQGLYDWFLGEQGAHVDALAGAAETAAHEAETALREEWGAAYDARLDAARRAALNLGGAEFVAHLDETGLGNDAQLVRLLAAAGERLGEARLEGPAGGNGDGLAGGPAAARREIQRLQQDAEFRGVYVDRQHPDHDAAVDRMRRLFGEAYPEPDAG